MMRIIMAVGLSLCTFAAQADGPPMTQKGEVFCDHLDFILSDEQIESAGRTRFVTLSSEQLKICQRINPDFPQRILVLSPQYRDCTCGIGLYGMWISVRHLAICTSAVVEFRKPGPQKPGEEAEESELQDVSEEKKIPAEQVVAWLAENGSVYVDTKGDLFVLGHSLSWDDFKNAMMKRQAFGEKEDYLWISIPPAGTLEVDTKVEKRLREIEALMVTFKIRTFTTG